jgi:alpha-tubulin suppressor-like RCC1 family protein
LKGIGRGRRILLVTALVALAGVAGAATSVLAGAAGGGELGSSLKAWGADPDGQLGDGQAVRERSVTPVAVSGLTCAVSAAVSDSASFAVLHNGTVAAWGADEDNQSGSFGDEGDHYPYSATPVAVPGVTGAVAVAADIPDVFVLLSDGTLVGWGDDHDGEFGDGLKETENGGSNVAVPIARGLTGVSAISASGSGSVLALLSDGEVDSWGEAEANDSLGRSGSGLEPGAVEISGTTPLTGATAVAEGANFSLALSNGEVKAWGGVGGSTNAVLGAGTGAVEGEVPVTVGGGTPLKAVSAIAAGSNFALALVNGEVMAWGEGVLGQLGDGSDSREYLPVKVTGLKDIVAIAATELDGYALDSEGHVWAWGSNALGELGTGTSEPLSEVPVEVESLGAGNTGLSGGIDALRRLRRTQRHRENRNGKGDRHADHCDDARDEHPDDLAGGGDGSGDQAGAAVRRPQARADGRGGEERARALGRRRCQRPRRQDGQDRLRRPSAGGDGEDRRPGAIQRERAAATGEAARQQQRALRGRVRRPEVT